jgi:hypothetical protein
MDERVAAMKNMEKLPSLRGKFNVGDITADMASHKCDGVWALSDAAHGVPDQTSAFSFSLEMPAGESINGMSFPVNGKYKGYFFLKQLKGPPVQYEDNIEMEFTRSEASQAYTIEGKGTNQFGVFTVTGTMTQAGELVMYRIYAKAKAVKRDSSARARKVPIPHDVAETITAGREKRTPQPIIKCGEILKELLKMPQAVWFTEAVDHVKLNLPDYPTIIKNPMCLNQIKENLDAGIYNKPEEFLAHIRLTFQNAKTYNHELNNPVHIAAKEMEAKSLDRYRSSILGIVPQPTPQHTASSAPKSKKKHTPATAGASSAPAHVTTVKATGGASSSAQRSGVPKGDTSQVAAMQRRMMEMQNEIRRLQKQVAPGDTKYVPPASSSGGGGGANRPLSYEEKANLVSKINTLAPARIAKVVEIIRSALAPGRHVNEGQREVEIAVDDIDDYTLHRLQKLVSSSGSSKKRPRN